MGSNLGNCYFGPCETCPTRTPGIPQLEESSETTTRGESRSPCLSNYLPKDAVVLAVVEVSGILGVFDNLENEEDDPAQAQNPQHNSCYDKLNNIECTFFDFS